jgi:hypothetical protein
MFTPSGLAIILVTASIAIVILVGFYFPGITPQGREAMKKRREEAQVLENLRKIGKQILAYTNDNSGYPKAVGTQPDWIFWAETRPTTRPHAANNDSPTTKPIK